jgi:multidrug efflux pump subunit AcrA (membrane-fusion protein)
MSQARRRWSGRLFALIVVGALVAGGWYAYNQGWLEPVQNWVSQSPTNGSGKAAFPGGHAGHGGMNMPGMDMGSMSAKLMGTPSTVPGHAPVMTSDELQQRIGVRLGQVEKGPLKMSVRAVGIVQPDETRIARVNIKTEGWVDELFVNFVGQQVRKGDQLLSI